MDTEGYRNLCAAIIEQAAADFLAGKRIGHVNHESAREFLFAGGLDRLALAAGLDVNLKAIKARLLKT